MTENDRKHLLSVFDDIIELMATQGQKVVCSRLQDIRKLLEFQQAEIEQLQPKKGHWEMKPDPFGLFDEIPVCSECGCMNDMRKKTAFCEHCGADMREGDGDAD